MSWVCPSEKTHFHCLYLWSCSFVYSPELLTIGEGRDVAWLLNWELHFYAQFFLDHNRPIQRRHHCSHSPNLLLHSLVIKTRRHIKWTWLHGLHVWKLIYVFGALLSKATTGESETDFSWCVQIYRAVQSADAISSILCNKNNLSLPKHVQTK